MKNRKGKSKEIEELAKHIVPVLRDGGVIEAIKRYTTDLTKADFFSSSEKQDAVYSWRSI